MKQLFLLFISMMFAVNIYSQNNTQTKKAMYVNINIDISYKDKEGNDLLGSTFMPDDIIVYNFVNGEKIKVNKPGKDYPNNHFIFKDDASKTNVLRVFLESEITLLQLNATTTDTIKCSFKKTKGSLHIQKVWYNGKLKFTYGKNASQVITIVK